MTVSAEQSPADPSVAATFDREAFVASVPVAPETAEDVEPCPEPAQPPTGAVHSKAQAASDLQPPDAASDALVSAVTPLEEVAVAAAPVLALDADERQPPSHSPPGAPADALESTATAEADAPDMHDEAAEVGALLAVACDVACDADAEAPEPALKHATRDEAQPMEEESVPEPPCVPEETTAVPDTYAGLNTVTALPTVSPEVLDAQHAAPASNEPFEASASLPAGASEGRCGEQHDVQREASDAVVEVMVDAKADDSGAGAALLADPEATQPAIQQATNHSLEAGRPAAERAEFCDERGSVDWINQSPHASIGVGSKGSPALKEGSRANNDDRAEAALPPQNGQPVSCPGALAV